MSVDQSSEVFRPIPGWTGYRISNWARLQSCKSPNGIGPLREEWRDLGTCVINGYVFVSLFDSVRKRRRWKKTCVLVLETFVGPRPHGQCCRHLDDDRMNNRLDNLAWGTRRENAEDSRRNGRILAGERHPNAVLNDSIVRLILRLRRDGMGTTEIANHLCLNESTIGNITAKGYWSHVKI